VAISSPLTGIVQSQQLVNGFIHPPGPVQVLVLTADNKWHLQDEVRLDGPFWSATCEFGPPGAYRIVAVAGCGISGRVLDEIPTDRPSSQIVQVRRTLPQPRVAVSA
jgi:hypothetical protein